LASRRHGVRAMVRVSLHYKERGDTVTAAMRWRIRFTVVGACSAGRPRARPHRAPSAAAGSPGD
jgi:hypothetical protein